MAGITLAQAEAQLALWLAASQAVALNQSYSIEGLSLTRADEGKILSMIDFWDRWCRKLSPGGSSRIRQIIPYSE